MNSGTTDNEIIARVLRGEHELYAELVKRYQDFVFTVALKYTPVREDAEEIAQDVFVKAYRSLQGFRGDSKLSTWLYTIVNSTAITFLRRKKPEARPLENEESLEIADQKHSGRGSHIVETKSRIEAVSRAIALLNPDDARLITLFYKAEQSLEEIGTILGIEANTVKVKLHRARQRLREKMEKYFAQDVRDLSY